MTTLLELCGVELAYGERPALRAVDLSILRGECWAVVGPNGAGKTTLLRIAAGLLEPSAGQVRWLGEPYRRLSSRERARRIAYVPQIRPARIPFTVAELLLQGRYPHRERFRIGASPRDLEVVARVLATVGLEGLRGRRLDQLSGGERQIAFIGAALAQEAPLLVLDEPTTHLDPAHRREVARLLLRLREEEDCTLLVATHDFPLAAHLADRAVAVAGGELQAVGAAREVLGREVLSALFATPFRVHGSGERPVPLPDLA